MVMVMVRGGGEEEAAKRKIKLSKNHTAAAGVLCLRLLLRLLL